MAFTGNFLCTSFKTELLKGVHKKYGSWDNRKAYKTWQLREI